MKVLVACEFSGVVRDAFLERGHDAISCDLLQTESPGPHIQGDVLQLLKEPWDLVIAHPPCTYLAHVGTPHMYIGRKKENGLCMDRFWKMREGAKFFLEFFNANTKRLAIENPRMSPFAKEEIQINPSFWVQPWQFGHDATKATYFWLKGLPPLMSTIINPYVNQEKWCWTESQVGGLNRAKNRAKTFPGIAKAMAEQWGSL